MFEVSLDLLAKVLRDNDLHEAECNVSEVRRANSLGGAYYYPQPCNCWLSQEEVVND